MQSSTKRVIPPGYIVCELALTGLTPLLMSSADVDREGDTFKAYRALSRKRGKSELDESRLRELEFHTRIYYDEQVGCFIPGRNIKAMLRAAATKQRKGEDVKRSLVIPEDRVALVYEGPRTPAELWSAGFCYTTMVANAGAGSGRVERTRPCFTDWSLTTEIAFDPEDLDPDDVARAVERSEKLGLGDYRGGGFGAFSTSLKFLREEQRPANASGAKARDKMVEQANAVLAQRVQAA